MTDPIARNIWRYQLFTAISFMPIMLPVIVLFWQENGLDMFQVYLLQSIFALGMVILEIPTGMIADRLGKRTSLIFAMSIMTIGLVVYAVGSSFWVFLLAELVLSLGISLLSGADSALLYDTLNHLGRQDDYQRIEGRARAIQMVVFALANLLGGAIGEFSYRATIWATAIGPFVGLILAIGFVEVNQPAPSESYRAAFKAYRELIRSSFTFVRKHQFVRWQVLFLGVTTTSGAWLLWLYQPYMELSHLPVWGFGAAFAIFNLYAAGASHVAHHVETRLGRNGVIMLFIILQVSPLILMGLVITPLSFLFILGHQTVRGMSRPIISDWILRYTYADKRATILSISSMGSRLFFALTSPLIGWIAAKTTLPVTLYFQAVFLVVLFGVLVTIYQRIPEKYFHVKDTVKEKH
ncbi:MAG: MFS transporter [Gemmatimonadetes bacterium]|nr:MAG: MFS transporter [Gemmatimonadota bacterium]